MIPALSFIIGCAILAFAADQFLKSSVSIAKRFALSDMVIGVVLIGFGTSFSEVIVSAVAALHGESQLAVGNVLGSNIANIGLVIGIAAMIKPLLVSSQFLRREFPVMVAVTLLVGFLLWDHNLSQLDGVVLLVALVVHLIVLFLMGSKDKVIAQEVQDPSGVEARVMPFKWALVMWPVGLALLFVSSELIVSGATAIARWLHLSEYLIGLTIVAVGTSLPELATLVLSAMKNQHDMAVGTILGSNIFNLLGVLAVPALIAPTSLPLSFTTIDYPLLLGFTLLFYLFAMWPKRVTRQYGRMEGALLILAYIGYVVIMVLTA